MPLDTERQVQKGVFIDNVTDLEHAPLPFRIEPDIDGPPMPRLLSQAGCCRRGARLGALHAHA